MSGGDGSGRPTALVLAGRRPGPAKAPGFPGNPSHKALLAVCGTPMILRVIGALHACPALGQVVVSAEPER